VIFDGGRKGDLEHILGCFELVILFILETHSCRWPPMKRSPNPASFVMKRSPVPEAMPGAWPERDGVGSGQLSLSITNSMEVLRQKLLRELIRRRQSGQYVASDQYLDQIG
jgi:hypothetical protein